VEQSRVRGKRRKKRERTPLQLVLFTSLDPTNTRTGYTLTSSISPYTNKYALKRTSDPNLIFPSSNSPSSLYFCSPLHSKQMSTSRPSRPTTPLRRISSYSLRSLSLSHSQSRDPTSTSESPLSHLSPLFAELADSISDFVANAEGLSQLTNNLNKFNQGFSSYLYGLRTNSYTFDFNNVKHNILYYPALILELTRKVVRHCSYRIKSISISQRNVNIPTSFNNNNRSKLNLSILHLPLLHKMTGQRGQLLT